MATNKSLKNDLKDISEKVVTNFNILESAKDENSSKQESALDTNKVQTLAEAELKKEEINDKATEKNLQQKVKDQIKEKDLIEDEKVENINLQMFKSYMELCNSTGLMQSWSEFEKFKKHYLG